MNTLRVFPQAMVLLLLLVTMVVGGVEDVEARTKKGHEDWVATVQRMKAEGRDVEVIKSENMTPEKTPKEFMKRLREESDKEGFNNDVFIKKVARGLKIERRYKESGIHTFSKQDSNPNYRISNDQLTAGAVVFNREQFCITPDMLRTICDEGRCRTYSDLRRIEYRSYGGGERIRFSYDENMKCIELMRVFRAK